MGALRQHPGTRGPLERFAAPWRIASLICWIACFVLACGRETPHLLTLSNIDPPAAEAGDDWTLNGEGFVERAAARVVFTGETTRAGFDPEAVSYSVETPALSQNALQLKLDTPLVDALLGADAAVRHATFRGSVSVAFAPRTPGAPPVMGVLKDVVLDVFRGDPSPGPEDASSRLVRRFGWQLEPSPQGEMCVRSLGESAEPSPLLVGDCILRFGSLNVFGVADLAPIAFAKRIGLLIRRDGAMAPLQVELDVAGLQAPNPSLWRWALGSVGILALVLLVCATPLGTALAIVEAGVRGRSGRSRSRGAAHGRHWGLAPFLVVSVAFGASHVGLLPAVRDFDVLLVYCAALPLLWLAGLVRGGGTSRWALTPGLKALFGSLAHSLGSALALCIPVLHNASLSLAQGSTPRTSTSFAAFDLGFFGFASPGAYLGAVTLLLCALSVLLTAECSERTPPAGARLRAHIARTLSETHCWALLGLFIALYAGGWHLPFAGVSATPGRELAVFQVKFSIAYLLFVALRLRVPALSEPSLRPIQWRWFLPLGLVAACMHLVWVAGQWPDWLQSATAIVLCAGSAALLTLTLMRLARTPRAEVAAAAVNPWL